MEKTKKKIVTALCCVLGILCFYYLPSNQGLNNGFLAMTTPYTGIMQ